MLLSNAALRASVRGHRPFGCRQSARPLQARPPPPQPPQPPPSPPLLPPEGNRANTTTAAAGMTAVSSGTDVASTFAAAVGESVPGGVVDLAAAAVILHDHCHGWDLSQPPQSRSSWPYLRRTASCWVIQRHLSLAAAIPLFTRYSSEKLLTH